jgi:hypothetical protein
MKRVRVAMVFRRSIAKLERVDDENRSLSDKD